MPRKGERGPPNQLTHKQLHLWEEINTPAERKHNRQKFLQRREQGPIKNRIKGRSKKQQPQMPNIKIETKKGA